MVETEVISWSRNSQVKRKTYNELQTNGYTRLNMEDAVQLANDEPIELVKRICGKTPIRIDTLDITPKLKSGSPFVASLEPTPFHTDIDLGLPAHLQILVCKRPARTGGDTFLLDTWNLLRIIRKDDPQLFGQLFSAPRFTKWISGVELSPTFNWRFNNLVCHHTAYPMKGDAVGEAFQKYVDKTKKLTFCSETNDVVAISNHRLLHGRTGFSDKNRHLIRLLVWFRNPIEKPPEEFVKRAKRYQQKLRSKIDSKSHWLQLKMGLRSETVELGKVSDRFLMAAHKLSATRKISDDDLGDLLSECGQEVDANKIHCILQSMILAAVQSMSQFPTTDDQYKILVALYNKLVK